MLSDLIDTVLLDIEGTTTPVDFVYGVLFPFARDHLPEYLKSSWGSPELNRDLSILFSEYQSESPTPVKWNSTDDRDGAIQYLLWLISVDRKSTGLKSIQGRIWESGYVAGTLKGTVYEDVPRAFERWKKAGKNISIFSSGSVLAQKLLFAHSTAGDLTSYLTDYFDTETGPKREASSYQKIASKLGSTPEQILFVSDIVEELEAASKAGMKCVVSVRPGNKAIAEPHTFRTIKSFDEIV